MKENKQIEEGLEFLRPYFQSDEYTTIEVETAIHQALTTAEQRGVEKERKRILTALKWKEISPGVTNGKSQFTAKDVYQILNTK